MALGSLHTKYRPNTFDEVIGQAAIVRSLKRVVKDNRAHAFMFVGPAGTGKTTLARLLAKAFTGDGTVNLYEYDAVSKSGAEDVRVLTAQLYYKSIGSSPVKFVIIDECHRLSATAWDVFLKPIEEPPAHVYFAFCTTIIGRIPKAILTRCLRYDLKPVKEDQLLDLICKVVDEEKIKINDDVIEAIVEESNGSPRQALVHLEACSGIENVTEAREIIRSAGQAKEVIDLARWLLAGKGLSWAKAVRLVKDLEGHEPESIRIVLQNYFAAVLMNTKQDNRVPHLLRLIEAFKTPYIQSDKLAPLLYSLGLALEMDR